jgi:hypothetical protein
MKSFLHLLAVLLLGTLTLTSCNGVNYGPSAYVPPPAVVPGYGWIGPGYYGGIYYPSSVNYYGSSYYRSVSGTVYNTPYANAGVYHGAYNSGAYYDNANGTHGYSYDGTGAAYGARGGSASWSDGSGSATGYRGGSASWSDGSGSATGYRGGTASWSDGSGSWHGAGGRSGSFRR